MDPIIDLALEVLEQKLKYGDNPIFSHPQETKAYVRLRMAGLEREEFSAMFLTVRHQLIAFETLFKGTIAAASVHPREVVKAALAHNAAAIILAHNHPSGVAEPSQADIRITSRLGEALALVDVRVLDHIVVGGGEVVSFAERGLI